MCAIAGVFGAGGMSTARDNLDRMLASMRHRGPDDTGVYLDEDAGIALGHNRLSIIDPSPAGRQPMINPDTGDVLIFNGEIYNHREIRQSLAACGVTFRSQSDTEVLLLAFEKWGEACLERLKGMYAFAIWRPREGALYLVRDMMGIKPLYYRTEGDVVIFASEIKAFRNLSNSSGRIDAAALGQFLEFGYTFEESRTIFSDVKKLPPGVSIIFRRDKAPAISAPRRPKAAAAGTRALTEIEEELFETLQTVVDQHLIADVPVGMLLSGGLDSSLIAALASRRVPLRTLTMGFGESTVDERTHARRIAESIGAQNEEIVIAAEEIRDEVSSSASLFDDIFADWGTISTRLLYKKARERGLKVVLVGEGADELFGGYPIFRASRSRLPTELWLHQLYRAYAGRRYGHHYSAFRRIMRGHLRETEGDRFGAIRLFETRNQLPNNYVMKVDKASMSVGVEARVPFLDQRVAELALQIPADALLTATSEKRLLREIAHKRLRLPHDCVDRPKFGAGVAASWMDDQPGFRAYARDVILSPGGWTEALHLKGAMEDYFLRNRSGRGFPHAISIFRNLAWRLLLLELWSKSMGVTARAD